MSSETRSHDNPGPSEGFAHVRYQVTDVARSIAFYTERLGFTLEAHAGTAFASVLLGKLRLILGGPGSSGARPLLTKADQSGAPVRKDMATV
jgi:glyoxylase I family protein